MRRCAPPSVVLVDGGAPAVLARAPPSVVLADGGAPAVLEPAPHSVVLADGGAPAVLAPAPPSVVLADGGAPAVLACAPLSVVLADGGAPAVLASAPHSVVLADGGAPAVLAHAPLTVMRAFLPRLRRPGPLLPLRLRLLLSPPLPACRFTLAPALSALAPLLAMPTLALSPASAPTTAPSFTVSVLPLLRLALALVLHWLPFLGGLASLGGPRHRQVHKRHRRQPRGHALVARGLGHPEADGLADARRGGRGAMPSLGDRWSARGTSRMGGTAGLCVLPVRRAQPQTRARRRGPADDG